MQNETMLDETGYTLLFETGEDDGYWTIEENPQGLLCVSSNAETRRVIDTDRFRGSDPDQLREALAADGVHADLIDRILEQAGF